MYIIIEFQSALHTGMEGMECARAQRLHVHMQVHVYAPVVFFTFVFFLRVSKKRLQKRRNHPRPPLKRWALSGYSVFMMCRALC